jgi:DNA-binding XRE family transcriptional regulator
MPKQIKSSTVPYDLEAWRKRCSLTQERAAQLLGVSTSKLWRIETSGQASLEMQWACYGLELFIYNQNH